MTVESVGATALGVLRPGAIRKVLLAGSLTVATGVALVLPTPAAHTPVIEGTERDDHMVGTAQFDRIWGLGGDDVVWARGSNDDVFGGPGATSSEVAPEVIIGLGEGLGTKKSSGGTVPTPPSMVGGVMMSCMLEAGGGNKFRRVPARTARTGGAALT